MGSWIPDTELGWLVPVSVSGILVLLELLLRPQVTRVTVDVMEFCDLGNLRESARSIWTNLGVTAALLLTVAVGLLQADRMEAVFTADPEMQDTLVNIQLAYNLFSAIALLYCTYGILLCVIYLCYVDPLSNRDAVKFFIANPATIGMPVLDVIFGSVYLLAALLLYVLGTSGLPNACIFGIGMLIILIHILYEIIDKGRFDPSGKSRKSNEWMWTQKDPSEWPWFMVNNKNGKAARVFTRMGNMIKEDQEAAEVKDAVPPFRENI